MQKLTDYVLPQVVLNPPISTCSQIFAVSVITASCLLIHILSPCKTQLAVLDLDNNCVEGDEARIGHSHANQFLLQVAGCDTVQFLALGHILYS